MEGFTACRSYLQSIVVRPLEMFYISLTHDSQDLGKGRAKREREGGGIEGWGGGGGGRRREENAKERGNDTEFSVFIYNKLVRCFRYIKSKSSDVLQFIAVLHARSDALMS